MQWYYSKNGAQQGPVTVDELKAKIASGEVQAGDLAWREGMTDWLPVTQIQELAATGEPAPGGSPEAEAAAPGDTAAPVQGGLTQPGVAQPGGMQVAGAPPVGSGKATAAMVLGICGLVFSCIACIGLILGILATVFGSQVMTMAQTQPELQPYVGKAKAGKIMGIIAIVLSVINGAAGVFININNGGFQGF